MSVPKALLVCALEYCSARDNFFVEIKLLFKLEQLLNSLQIL